MDPHETAKRSKKLLLASLAFLLGFVVFVLLHNLFSALQMLAGGTGLLAGLFRGLSVISFVAALGLCPAGIVFCAALALLVWIPVPGPTWLRTTVLLGVATLAAVLALRLVGGRRLSTIERDPSAGLNGSFEVARSGIPVNWYVYHRPLEAGEATLTLDTLDAADGRQSVRIETRTVGGRGWNAPGLFHVEDAVNGETYDVSFWLKQEGGRVGVRITSEKPESGGERQPITETFSPDSTGGGAWRRFTYTYTVPARYVDVRFELNVLSPGTVWIDGVSIEKATETSASRP